MKKILGLVLVLTTTLTFGQSLEEALRSDNWISIKSEHLEDSTLLHQAIMAGAQDISLELINRDACLNCYNEEGYTALLLAIQQKEVSIFEKLIRKNVDLSKTALKSMSETPLMIAAVKRNPIFLERLINAGVDINQTDLNGDPALNYATYYGNIRNMKLLIKAGANLNIKSIHGQPVDVGLRLWHADSVMQVFKSTNSYAEKKKTKEVWSKVKNGNLVQVKESNMTDALGTPLIHLVAETNNIDELKYLLKSEVNVNKLNRVGQSALSIAARFGNQEIVELLLKNGADPNLAGEEYKLTPMIGAAIGANTEIGDQLIRYGANLNTQDKVSEGTPLHWSLFYRNIAFADWLIESGADLQIKALKNTYEPYDLAIAMGFGQLAQKISGTKAEHHGLRGSWKLDSMAYVLADRTISFEVGSPGALVIEASRYAIMYTGSDEARIPFKDISKPTEKEIIEGFKSIVFNSGSYQLEDNVFVTTCDIAKVPGFETGIQYYRYAVNGSNLSFTMYDETYPNGNKPDWFGKVEVAMYFSRE